MGVASLHIICGLKSAPTQRWDSRRLVCPPRSELRSYAAWRSAVTHDVVQPICRRTMMLVMGTVLEGRRSWDRSERESVVGILSQRRYDT